MLIFLYSIFLITFLHPTYDLAIVQPKQNDLEIETKDYMEEMPYSF